MHPLLNVLGVGALFFAASVTIFVLILLDKPVLLCEIVCIEHPPAAAAEIYRVAIDQILHGQSLRSALMLDRKPRLHGRGGSESPTRPAPALVTGHSGLTGLMPIDMLRDGSILFLSQNWSGALFPSGFLHSPEPLRELLLGHIGELVDAHLEALPRERIVLLDAVVITRENVEAAAHV